MLFAGTISAGRKKRHHAAFVDRLKGIVKKTKWDNTIINESNGADMFFLILYTFTTTLVSNFLLRKILFISRSRHFLHIARDKNALF